MPEEDGSKGFLMFAQQGDGFLPPLVWLLNGVGPGLSRIIEGQSLQGPEGQTHLHTQLLQGHLRSEMPLAKFPVAWLTAALYFLVVRFRFAEASPQRGRGGCFPAHLDLRRIESEPRAPDVQRRVSPFAWPRLARLTLHPRFINRFRNPAKLQSEAGYYLSSLVCMFCTRPNLTLMSS